MQAPFAKPPLAVVFDSAIDQSIDQVLALALVSGFDAKREARVVSLSVSRYNLSVAAFCDLVARFYGGNGAPVGMATNGAMDKSVPPMLAVSLSGTRTRGIQKLNDTADAAALIRNGFTAQTDQNCVVVLAGPATNLAEVLALPGAKELITKKVRVLALAMDGLNSDIAAAKKLFAEWPTPIVIAGEDFALQFPAESIEKDFAWAPNHPVAEAYRAFKPMPYDAQVRAMAAALYAVHPEENYFKLSMPCTVVMSDDGQTVAVSTGGGKHRYLTVDPAQKDRAIAALRETASSKPAAPGRGRGPGKAVAKLIVSGIAGSLVLAGAFRAIAQEKPTFENRVRPLFTQTCSQCHNAQLASGGLNVGALSSANSMVSNRAEWEKILRRVRDGEMPPPDVKRPPDSQMNAFVNFVQGEFDRADASIKPDPGRVTAHRLNRNEYSNTIRDLLGVDFRAEKYFPTDDSGDGFDNIGEVLTVSPVLMEKYMTAAERIADWALSTEIPAKSITVEYASKDKRITRVDRSTVEAAHRVDFAGDYTIRFGLPGERAADAKPVTLGFWMDGKLLHTMEVQTKPSGLVYFDPYSEEEMHLYLPVGDHVFRAGFINDDFVKDLADKDVYSNKKNKFFNSIVFIGPTASKVEKESRKKILLCNPESGQACVERIVSTLARRAYRRPVTHGEVTSLLRFVDLAKSNGQSTEQGIQLAIQAILVSPNFLFHIERDASPTDPSKVHQISDVELASRLSYFLWSSMPDDELLNLAEAGKLRGVLDEQVKRMLADPRSGALAANFAGQWLETRNLDFISPDPKKFPEWNPELRDAMKTETTMFFEYMLRENRPISEFLDARYTFLNERLAKHYGIDGVSGPEFRRVDLTTDQRGGVLSQAGVLTVSSYPTRTSPVIRGKYVLQNILGTPPPPPPPDVPVLDEGAIGTVGSLRQQLEKHRNDPTCASCHGRMDPLGFGLENYDAIGKWRTMDGKFPVDSSGTLPDGKIFGSPAEMRAILTSQLPQFSRTLIEKMLTYSLGRGLKTYDGRTVDNMNRELAASGYRFQTLIQQIVQSVPFQSRRGEEVAEK
jgi:mono/diheme cytochrome c family protein